MIESFFNNLPEFLSDAVIDSLKLIPSLFIIFLFIEIFENYFAHKVANIMSFSKKMGPLFGAMLAIIPQCGFSVIMTTLFIKRYITIGTLTAVYIATSDEAIPILIANPSEYSTVLKIILIKLFMAILVGYGTDFALKEQNLHHCKDNKKPCMHLKNFESEKGCCKHDIKENKIKNIIIHPIKHTFIIFLFILFICVCLNYILNFVNEETYVALNIKHPVIEIILFTFFGLIPNCAVSVLITMLYLKNIIGFASVIAGLITNAGLGLLILFTRKRSFKNFLIIISILIATGFLTGIIFSLI